MFKEESRQRAKWLDARRKEGYPCGKLHGVIVTLKDVISYKEHKVTASSKMLSNYISIYNSTVVEKLLAEDAIVIGSCNCDEFAMGNTNENSAYGRVKNAMVKDPIAMYLADIYTIFANLTRIAGASVPLFKHSNGLPFGVQVLAARNNDVTLLEFSNLLFNRFK